MRILMCSSEAPLAPENGLRLQLRALSAELARRHEVCAVGFVWPDQSGEPPPGVELVRVDPPRGGLGGRVRGWLRAAARGVPVESAKLVAPMAKALAPLVERRRFDVAHVGIGMLAPVRPALGALPAVVAPLDAWHLNVRAERAGAHGARRLLLPLHERLVLRFTASAYRPYARTVLVTPQDAAEARRLDPDLRTVVIPNGVDAGFFRPGDVPREPGLVVFTGALHAPANVDAAVRLAERVLPALRRTQPAARLALVGRAPAPAVRALARLPGVEVVGEVPDLRPWLWRAAAYACPMTTGTGIKNKLLEALACGVPAVATPLACQGLDVRDGQELLVAGDERAIAAALGRLLGDERLRERLAATGRAYAVSHHGWGAVAAAYERLYEEVAGAGGR
jgi:glycosyltransferase involved in cell wall biosynthesis